MVDPVNIEARAELVRAQSIEVGTTLGGIQVASLADFAKIADLLSRAGVAVPTHCRDKPGTCFALCIQANEWRMPVMGVLNKSYVVVNKGVERIAFESQMIHAVIERNAPLKGRLRAVWSGEGDERRCKVMGTFKGETEPHTYESEPLGKLRDARGRNEYGTIKGSPLWDTQPDVQLFYSTTRQWARLYCPDVILGAYTPEDPQWNTPTEINPVVNRVEELAQKLRDAKAASVGGDRGFDADYVRGMAIIEGEAKTGDAKQEGVNDERNDEPDVAGRQDDAGDRADADRDKDGSQASGGDDREVVGDVAGKEGADTDDETFPPDRKPKGKTKR